MPTPLPDTSNLPAIASATLPAAYEAAKSALASCERVDECKEWADKSAAVASYAKQAGDETLMNHAVRIRSRAIQRCGELLRAIAPTPMAERPRKQGEASPPVSRETVARRAGLSDDQRKTALRVAAIPADEFEALVESPTPPTITELAERGKRPAPARPIEVPASPLPKFKHDLAGRTPEDFAAATIGIGELRRLHVFIQTADVPAILRGCKPHERRDMSKHAEAIYGWLVQLIQKLEAAK